MYIEPNTTIRILKDCPLDTTYDHTVFFKTKAEQTRYFSSLTKYTLNNQTYQRVNRNSMRVQYKADDLYDCNYIMFQNTNFGNKWFYAFIKSVEYVNNITCQIEYEIDVMQTWFFDYTLGQCFVEREHSATDVAGDNTVPENLELGDYVSEDFDASGVLGEKSIVVAATFDENYDDVGGTIYSSIYSGLYFNVFPNTTDGASACTEFLRNAGAKTDGIVAVFLMPTNMVTELGGEVKGYSVDKEKFANIKRADGTPIKNNKLLTYPYNFMYVTTLQGNYATYHYEYFENDNCEFFITGDMSPNPAVIIAPKNYKGVPTNYDEKMVLAGFPQLSFNVDSFKAWLAQSASSLAVNAMSTGVGAYHTYQSASLAAQTATTAAGIAGAGLAASLAPVTAGIAIAGVLAPVVQHSMMPDQARGGLGNQTMAAVGLLDFAFMHKHIKPEFVTIIDDYFNMFGYATHKVKVPNRAVRPHWTYTKTVGCVVNGSVPCDDMDKICSIYNNGITFWNNGNEVGNYSLDNRPV